MKEVNIEGFAFPAEGEMPAAIIRAWQSVWEHFSKEHAQFSGPTTATIYIGIKSPA